MGDKFNNPFGKLGEMMGSKPPKEKRRQAKRAEQQSEHERTAKQDAFLEPARANTKKLHELAEMSDEELIDYFADKTGRNVFWDYHDLTPVHLGLDGTPPSEDEVRKTKFQQEMDERIQATPRIKMRLERPRTHLTLEPTHDVKTARLLVGDEVVFETSEPWKAGERKSVSAEGIVVQPDKKVFGKRTFFFRSDVPVRWEVEYEETPREE